MGGRLPACDGRPRGLDEQGGQEPDDVREWNELHRGTKEQRGRDASARSRGSVVARGVRRAVQRRAAPSQARPSGEIGGRRASGATKTASIRSAPAPARDAAEGISAPPNLHRWSSEPHCRGTGTIPLPAWSSASRIASSAWGAILWVGLATWAYTLRQGDGRGRGRGDRRQHQAAGGSDAVLAAQASVNTWSAVYPSHDLQNVWLATACPHSTGTKVKPEQVLELVEKYYDLSQLEVEEEDAELESVEQDFELPANFSAPNPNNGS
eukprot:scaffold2979_cov405-Prasinococcus_capsulatus_cf.AAC.15